MKKLGFFILGAILGVVACFLLLYATGSILDFLGISLYKSEMEQQRNFNIFLVVSAISAIISGYIFTKKYAKMDGKT